MTPLCPLNSEHMTTATLANAHVVYKVRARSHRQGDPDEQYTQITVNLVEQPDHGT